MHKLTEASHLSEEKIGGKALRLARLIAAGFKVKTGIILTVDEVNVIATSGFLTETQRSTIVTVKEVAVRSSAVGEDGAEVSWAGQFETKLFVSATGIEDAILQCAAASQGDRVKAYAAAHDLAAGRLAIIIQEMIDATCAGVLFTTNPRDPQSHEMVIEVVEGVGEKLVNGSCTPRRYRIQKDGTVIAAEGAPIPELTAAQLTELAAVGLRVRDLFGCEQDIEWAIERNTGELWLLQSRDITTLNQKTKKTIGLQRDRVIDEIRTATDQELQRLADLGLTVQSDVWSDQNIAELLTSHPCRMAFDLFTTVFAHGGAICQGRNEMGYAIGPELDTGFFRLVGGQPRCSIVHDACTYRIRGFDLLEYGKLVEYYLARLAGDNRLGNYPEVVLYDQNPSIRFLKKLYGQKRARELRMSYDHFFSNLQLIEDTFDDQCQRQFIPNWQETIRRLKDTPASHDLPALIKRFTGLVTLLRDNACIAFVKGARLGFFAFARLRQLLQDLFGSEGEHYLNVVTAGIPVERNPNLDFNVALAGIRQGTASLETISEKYGHLALHELEISVPRHADDPTFLAQLAEQTQSDPLNDFHESQAHSQAVAIKIRREAGPKAEKLEREIRLAQTYLSLREMIKFEYLKAYRLIRQTLGDMEQILKWDDGLIFHLTVKEVALLEKYSQILKQRARERKTVRKAEQSLFIPSVFDTKHLEDIGNPRGSEGGRFLYGIGVTNEVAEGEAVVMHHFNDRAAIARLRPGMILVTATTDPAWSTVLALVGKTGGLVTEIGGLLAHGAIYAREMSLAAVLNVPQATTKIQTGMHIRVNGPGGYVEIINNTGR